MAKVELREVADKDRAFAYRTPAAVAWSHGDEEWFWGIPQALKAG
jgi:hypothetical protein